MKQDDVRELIREEETKLSEQAKEILEEIQNDPTFLAKYQKNLEKELLNFRCRLDRLQILALSPDTVDAVLSVEYEPMKGKAAPPFGGPPVQAIE